MDKNNTTLKDITTREDIEFLMRTFYNKALKDSSIGTFFNEIAQIDLEIHIPHISDFWEQQLFYTGNYKKNVLQIHQNLNLKKAMEKIHFDTWLNLFTTTVDNNFIGTRAELMKTRALSIATVIQLKIR
ncbi:group III truncated hemoglobin [Aquimarina sp. 2201CG14-23]|uniref:group III truncated hemoglobin n=1 Tax=Aquimarina mycalae TaxID=3040073 RepID=UPI002477DEC7|nr:group III truncated hemoglobin [Aquimarina sp. 2201CG14-23]MDH7444851.1 group III truncated hemoglobin [Aquimarina sp. 2201CG14-23]